MKKVYFCLALSIICTFATLKTNAIPNPWIDCGDDISCGAQKAGFNFPLNTKNYSVRAMEGMIEITFPIGTNRIVTARKVLYSNVVPNKNGIKDLSGDYNIYPINKDMQINNIPYSIRGYKNKLKVVSFSTDNGFYSFVGENIRYREIKYLYKLIYNADTPAYNNDNTDKYTYEELLEHNRTEEIVETIYTQDCFPRTLQKMGVTKECFDRANLGNNAKCTISQLQIIKEYYKRGQNKDPLNGSCQFCAAE